MSASLSCLCCALIGLTPRSSQVRYLLDRYITAPATSATAGFPVNLHIPIKCRHRIKYTNTGANTSTGEVIYIVCQSNNPSGTTAPVLTGVLECFFKP